MKVLGFKVRGFHELANQRPPEGRTLMVIQSWGLEPRIQHWPMKMSVLGGHWRWEPTAEYPRRVLSSTVPTHWRFPVPSDERYEKLPPAGEQS